MKTGAVTCRVALVMQGNQLTGARIRTRRAQRLRALLCDAACDALTRLLETHMGFASIATDPGSGDLASKENRSDVDGFMSRLQHLLWAGTGGEPGMSASGGLPQAAPTRELCESGPSWTAGKAGLGRSADSGNRHGGRCDREPAGRDPHQRQEGRSASPTSSPAIRQEGHASVLDEPQSSTGCRQGNPP